MQEEDEGQRKFSYCLFYTFMFLLIITGTVETITIKVMNNTVVLGQIYTHIWFILFIQGFGELLFLPVFYFIKKKGKIKIVDHDLHHNLEDHIIETYYTYESHLTLEHKEMNFINQGDEINYNELNIQAPIKKPQMSFLFLCLPGICDLISNILTNYALRLLPGSVYSIFSISTIFFTKIFSVFFIKNHIYRHHNLGLLIITGGLALIALTSSSNHSHLSSPVEISWGIILTLSGQVFTAIQFTLEELFMKKYECHPLRAVGWEGFWVTLTMLTLLITFQHIPCTPPPEGQTTIISHICSVNEYNKWSLEDTLFALRQIGASPVLLITSLLLMIGYSMSIFSGIFFSVYSTSAARAVVDGVRPFFIWLFFLMPFIAKEHREIFNYLQFIGFVLVITGNLTYNEVISISFCNMNYYTREKIKKRILSEHDNIKDIFIGSNLDKD